MYPTSKISFNPNMTKYVSYNIECLASSIKRKLSNLLSVHIYIYIHMPTFTHCFSLLPFIWLSIVSRFMCRYKHQKGIFLSRHTARADLAVHADSCICGLSPERL